MTGPVPFVLDAAVGTQLLGRHVPADDLDTAAVRHPDLVSELHREAVTAGAVSVQTASFGAHAAVLCGRGSARDAALRAESAARLARREADAAEASVAVVGSVGGAFPAVSQDAARAGYEAAATGLLDGGADVVCLETVVTAAALEQAVGGIATAMRHRSVPLVVLLSPSATGLLRDVDDDEALRTVAAATPSAVGVNCVAPAHAVSGLRTLSALHMPLWLRASAGLPDARTGAYPLDPADFAQQVASVSGQFGLAAAGGCCGTDARYVAALRAALGPAGAGTTDRRLGLSEWVTP